MTTEFKKDNPSFVLHGVQDTRIEQRPVPEIKNDQVLIAVSKTGICGSDVHYLCHGKIGSFVVEQPMCLGHESSGIIAKLGPDVPAEKRFKVGDRVALEPGVSCKKCAYCKAGKYELCPKMSFAATPPSIYGTLARYYVLPADMIYPLPDSVSMEDGAMMEPLAVGVHSVANLGACTADQNVVIFGAGPVGLLCMAVAKAMGARRVIAVDINADRLAFAKSYAATDTVIPVAKSEGEAMDAYTERLGNVIREELNIPALGDGSIDLAIDASGASVCIATGIHMLKPAGTFVQVGMGAPTMPIFPMFHLLVKEIKFYGSFRYGPGDYPLAISLVARGLVDLKPLVTHRYEFENALEAFETTQNGKDKNGKASIKCIISAPL